MDFRRIDVNLLVAFDAMVSEANVSRAAPRLHRSQSTLSHTLARMRATSGDPILVRQVRDMEATPQALAAMPEGRSIRNDSNGIRRWVRDRIFQGVVA